MFDKEGEVLVVELGCAGRPLPLSFTGKIHSFIFNFRVIVEMEQDNFKAIWPGLKAIISPN